MLSLDAEELTYLREILGQPLTPRGGVIECSATISDATLQFKSLQTVRHDFTPQSESRGNFSGLNCRLSAAW